jgi:hypothetical protein
VVAVSAILIVYRIYNRIADTPAIEPPDQTGADLPDPVFDEGSPTINGTVVVGQAENARYTFVDDQTKEVTRVFGFQKLLNPEAGTRKWNLQKPYINMYEKTFDCEITADRGTLTVETVKGNPSPTDGQLYDNVVIRVRARQTDRPIDSVIYMDQLNYNSERSEFSTEGPLRVVSPRAEMEARGMLLIYNPAMSRIEFLKVVHLDYLHLKDIESFSTRADDEAAPAEDADKAMVSAESPEVPALSSVASVVPVQPAPAIAAPKPASAGEAAVPTAPASADDFYVCTFSRDVVIEYGGEVTVLGDQEIVINNILWSGSRSEGGASSPDAAATGAAAAGETTAGPDTPAAATGGQEAHAGGAAAETDVVSGDAAATPAAPETVAAAAEVKPPVDVHVTCKGGFMAKPLTSVFEVVEPSLSRPLSSPPGVASAAPAPAGEGPAPDSPLAAETAVPGAEGADTSDLPMPAHFKARRISYDMTTSYGLAEGPVELTFLPAADAETDPNATVLPMVVTAERDAEFFANADRVVERIVFNEDVVGTRKVLTPQYLQTSSFHGRTLTTHLETDKQSERSGAINHISVTEGNVRLRSIRTTDDGEVISNVGLACLRIDYDAVKSIVHAAGPGNIQLNNKNAPPPPPGAAGGKLSLSGPCFALVKGFDKLTWFTEGMQINADGEELYLAYWPIEGGRWGRITSGQTQHLQANFWPLPEGGSELATVITAGGIFYEEDGGNIFKGEDMLYDAEKGLLLISGSENNPCFVNGAMVDRIEYDVNTGKVRSSLAPSPGAVTVPVKP